MGPLKIMGRLLLMVVALTAVSCGGEEDPAGTAADPTPSPSPVFTPTPTPTATPTPNPDPTNDIGAAFMGENAIELRFENSEAIGTGGRVVTDRIAIQSAIVSDQEVRVVEPSRLGPLTYEVNTGNRYVRTRGPTEVLRPARFTQSIEYVLLDRIDLSGLTYKEVSGQNSTQVIPDGRFVWNADRIDTIVFQGETTEERKRVRLFEERTAGLFLPQTTQ